MVSIRCGLTACVVAGMCGLVLLATPRPADAFFRGYNEAWCMITTDGLQDCSYYTWNQCRAAASGLGNFCFQNPRFHPVAEPAPRKRKRKVQR
jgi:hypothetical protein